MDAGYLARCTFRRLNTRCRPKLKFKKKIIAKPTVMAKLEETGQTFQPPERGFIIIYIFIVNKMSRNRLFWSPRANSFRCLSPITLSVAVICNVKLTFPSGSSKIIELQSVETAVIRRTSGLINTKPASQPV